MAEQVLVKAEVREARGKNDARRLRSAGKLPAIVYGGGEKDTAVIVELSDLAAILRSDSGQNTVFSLDIDGIGATDVMFHDRQIDPIKGRLMHADLRRIKRGEKIEVTVSILIVGEPETMAEGGVLTQQMREVKVLCVPSKIPESIEVDVTKLEMNESIHVSDLKLGEGVEIHEDPEAVIAAFVFVKEQDLEPTPEEELSEPKIVGEEGETAEGGETEKQ
jgi:large subunit ribosomal protein L25